MNGLTAAAVLVALAVLVWPRRPRADGRGIRHPGTARTPGPAGRGRGRWRRPEGLRIRGGLGGRGRDGREVAEILTLLDALVPALRAGLAPADALRAVSPPDAAGPPAAGLLVDLLTAADRGAPLAPVWAGWADRTGSSDVALVASAWALCERLGAPLAATVTTVATVVRRRLEVQRRTAAALAGPRASMTVLSALPAVGPLLALVMGLSPVELYASAAGAAALGMGLVLLLLGRWWGSRLVRSVGLGESGEAVGRRSAGASTGAEVTAAARAGDRGG